MKVGTKSENLLELIALSANLVPLPLIHTQIYPMLSKAILEAHSLDVFEVFAQGARNVEEAAIASTLEPKALGSLLRVLHSCGYLDFKNGRYELTALSRKWCLKGSPNSLYNMQRYNQVTWDWMAHLNTFLKTGEALSYHDSFNEEEWMLYQKDMESIAGIVSKFITKIGPRLKNPVQMLDIGGSHGLFSLEYIDKYPTLSATILDLPGAVEQAEPLLREHYTGDRIKYWQGDALTENFDEEQYDLIFIASLMHHFSEEQNRLVCEKVRTGLKKNGYFVIQEFLKDDDPSKTDMIPSVMDLFFNLSSRSGGWSGSELIAFQEGAGLKHIAIKKFWAVPGLVQVIGRKV